MQKILTVMEKIILFILAVFVAAMAIIVCANVIMRYAFNSGLPWAEELARILFIWVVFLGAAASLKDNTHIGVDIIVKRVPVNYKKAVFIFSNLVITALLLVVFFGSWTMMTIGVNGIFPATGIPLAFLYGAGVVSAFVMLFITFVKLYRLFTNQLSEQELQLSHNNDEMAEEHLDEEGRRP